MGAPRVQSEARYFYLMFYVPTNIDFQNKNKYQFFYGPDADFYVRCHVKSFFNFSAVEIKCFSVVSSTESLNQTSFAADFNVNLNQKSLNQGMYNFYSSSRYCILIKPALKT